MKFISPHDPLDEWIAAALHGELTPEEQTQFETRLQNDAAARAAYQEAQTMNDLLEKTYRAAQPDPAFEQRIVSGVRRKIQDHAPAPECETAWESVLVLWAALRRFTARRRAWEYAVACVVILGLAMIRTDKVNLNSIARKSDADTLPVPSGDKIAFGAVEIKSAVPDQPTVRVRSGEDVTVNTSRTFYYPNALRGSQGSTVSNLDALAGRRPIASTGPSLAHAGDDSRDLKKIMEDQKTYVATAQKGIALSGYVDSSHTYQFAGQALAINNDSLQVNALKANLERAPSDKLDSSAASRAALMVGSNSSILNGNATANKAGSAANSNQVGPNLSGYVDASRTYQVTGGIPHPINGPIVPTSPVPDAPPTETRLAQDTRAKAVPSKPEVVANAKNIDPTAPVPQETENPNRKLIRDADLELEVKSFQAAMDRITELTKAAGGYVDTDNSQRGGNGKLQGVVVVKVLPRNLDDFLLKLRDLGEIKNETVKADDVTKQYFDTQARIDNARRMETQLQELLKRTYGKVSDLLQVERELGRVRGEIEQMQGQLKLYDFQVQYATVTLRMREKDLNQAAAYLLTEQDNFSLFAADVETAFQKARHAAEGLDAQILDANVSRDAGRNVSAELKALVAPEQIEAFIAGIKTLGRIDQSVRRTERIANDGGNSEQPSEQPLTKKDKVLVNLTIKFDDDSRKHVALTVVTATVEEALDRAKAATLAVAGAEILNASLDKTAQGQSTGLLTARVPGKNYPALLDALRGLGRALSFSLQREDQSETHDENAPVIVSLQLTNNDVPQQQTEMSVLATEVDAKAQDVKKQAAAAGAQVKASSFERQSDGREFAQMTFLLPMAKYPAFIENLKKLGQVESLTVHREDRPDQTQADESAPAEITLRLYSQGNLIADDHGLWATVRQTFGEGAAALLGSLRTIGVTLAFLTPWIFILAGAVWLGRRIYIWRRK